MSKKPSKSIRRRGARLAAIQALYDIDIAGHHPTQAIDSFRLRGSTADLDGETLQADGEFFTELVQGVSAIKEDLDRMIAEAAGGRNTSNLEILLRAILRSGTFELARRDDIDAPVVISEYLTITAGFYDTAETGFVNGILDRLAKVLRDGDHGFGDVGEDLPQDDAGHG